MLKALITPLALIVLLVVSWGEVDYLASVNITSGTLLVLLAAISLVANALVLKRLSYLYGTWQPLLASVRVTVLGVLGNVSGMPLGTAAKFYYWKQLAGVGVRKIFTGMAYFSVVACAISFLLAVFIYGFFNSVGYCLALAVTVVIFLLLVLCKLFYRLESISFRVVSLVGDSLVSVFACALLCALFVVAAKVLFPEYSLERIFLGASLLVILGYLTMIPSFSVGQEILAGSIMVLAGENFSEGVGVSLVVRFSHVIAASIIYLGLLAFDKASLAAEERS